MFQIWSRKLQFHANSQWLVASASSSLPVLDHITINMFQNKDRRSARAHTHTHTHTHSHILSTSLLNQQHYWFLFQRRRGTAVKSWGRLRTLVIFLSYCIQTTREHLKWIFDRFLYTPISIYFSIITFLASKIFQINSLFLLRNDLPVCPNFFLRYTAFINLKEQLFEI